MSKLVEYVGIWHVMKDHIKEAWTQYWENASNSGSLQLQQANGNGNFRDEKEANIKSKVQKKLENFRQKSIQAIDSSTTDQEDYSHLTRPKTRKELMQISAAVMGIEFSYAAETAFVSPLLLNLGLRHRHMTLIWCLSPLLGLFVTPILGSLSDGCRSPLGRRRPFIILLSIGIILGLILVPNGKMLGRLLGDKYLNDKPPSLKTSSEMANRLLLPPHLVNSQSTLTTSTNKTDSPKMPQEASYSSATFSTTKTPTVNIAGNHEQVKWKQTFYKSPMRNTPKFNSNSGEVEEDKLRYKKVSKYLPMDYNEHDFRARNSLTHKDMDLERNEFFKSLGQKDKRLKINQEELQHLIFQATRGENKEASGESDSREKANQDSKTNSLLLMTVTSFNNNASNENRSVDGDVEEQDRILHSKRLGASGKELEGNRVSTNFDSENEDTVKSHPWGLVFTVIGTVLLDFDADACQSPSRAYMLDVTLPEDHAKGLSTFTVMAGLGGTIGYCLGALNWENTFLGQLFGGHVRAVFTLVLFIFIACVTTTIRSFRELPLERIWVNKGDIIEAPNSVESSTTTTNINSKKLTDKKYARFDNNSTNSSNSTESTEGPSPPMGQKCYGAVEETSFNSKVDVKADKNASLSPDNDQEPTFKEYVKTIVKLPRSLQWLCVTNFFCWMSLVCYSLYFTDFVGESVFGGNPAAPEGSPLKEKYDKGVRFGCWGMSLYSLSCSIYSLCIDSLVNRFGARRVYICGQLVYSGGMVCMGASRHPVGVIVFSSTAGIMYATLFTMPYLLVARYHAADTFDVDFDDLMDKPSQRRGLGTDVAIVSSMVFLAQITQALILGHIVTVVGSTTAIVYAASVFAFCGALSATKVLYLDL